MGRPAAHPRLGDEVDYTLLPGGINLSAGLADCFLNWEPRPWREFPDPEGFSGSVKTYKTGLIH